MRHAGAQACMCHWPPERDPLRSVDWNHNHFTSGTAIVHFSLRASAGFSTLQTTAGIIISGVLTGTALHYFPDILDQADREVTRYAASAESVHQEIWTAYEEIQGINAKPRRESVRHGFSAANDLVASPLGGYCFDPEAPEDSLQDCPVAASD